MGIVFSIFVHPTAALASLADLVLLFGKVDIKIEDLLLGLGEGGCSSIIKLEEGGSSSTTIQGGNSGMLGSGNICTSSPDE
jgi:hypothetical protein